MAKEVDRLHEAGVIVSAAFVKGDDERSLFRKGGMSVEAVNNALDQRFQDAEFRAGRVSVTKTVRLEVGDGKEMAAIESVEEIDRVFNVCLALRRIAHDRCRILKRVADIAIEVAAGADHHIDGIRGAAVEAGCSVEPPPIETPTDLLFLDPLSDAATP